MNPVATDPLAQLRDIHLPPPVSWWPPAPGWWGVLLLILLAGYLIWRFRDRLKRAPTAQPQPDYQRAALAELTALETAWKERGDGVKLLEEISRLLRRYALARFPRERVSGLVGSEWLSFLDETGGAGRFAEGAGRLLISGPYGGGGGEDPEPVLDAAKNWIEANP